MRYFVIRGFGVKRDSSGKEFDFDRVDRELIAPALAQCDFEGGTTGEIPDSGSIHDDMYRLILQADVVVCDISVHNANVFYELGARHALRRKRTVLLKCSESADRTPFDLGDFRYLPYSCERPADAVPALVAAIRRGATSERETDSPIFRALRDLPEAPSDAAVPNDFAQEVQRAKVARDRGWLLMLADELRNLPFERPGLRLVAFAQQAIEDFEAARDSLERLLRLGDRQTGVRFALANIYERSYRRSGRPELMDRAERALDEVLQHPDLPASERAEALALRGRNLKTLWRRGFEGIADVGERRARACKRQLLDSWQAYRESFRRDLNSFYCGIACLQVGHTLLSLSGERRWQAMFRSAREAARQRGELHDELRTLRHVVAAAIERGLAHGSESDRCWARISRADLRFLTGNEADLRADPSILLDDYEHALLGLEPFYRGAAIGQLQLFAAIGLRAAIAEALIAALHRDELPAAAPPHLVLFAGHQIDETGRRPPRFPAYTEEAARKLLREHLVRLRAQHGPLLLLASAAPGADILAHEICAELGIPTLLCLPMPLENVSALAFGKRDDWRNRLLTLARQHAEAIRVLQDGPELPRWLNERNPELWQRGIRWIVRSAQAWRCSARTLLALWDGDENDSSTGGVAEVVRQARETGAFTIEWIDSRQLLAANG